MQLPCQSATRDRPYESSAPHPSRQPLPAHDGRIAAGSCAPAREAAGACAVAGPSLAFVCSVGCAVLWGILRVLAFPRLRLWFLVAVMFALDLILMPLCAPVVVLNRNWIQGEAVALLVVLLPAACLARWTTYAAYLSLRAAMLV